MAEHEYLKWMAENTPTQWCNDSAKIDELQAALESGAIGCTSNPPLSYQTLTESPGIFAAEVAHIRADAEGDERAVELIGVVVRHISGILRDLYVKSGGRYGYIRCQVQPSISADAGAMLKMGKTIASWGENIMVKIPGTAAGIEVLEELAAMGIPTTATVCVSLPQILAAGEANERGIARAKAAGIAPAASTAAIVQGRLQDYFTVLNKERGSVLSPFDLECAALAVVKRCYSLFVERGYSQILMPAAFRSFRQVEQMVGSAVHMTIHPKIQDEIRKADAEGKLARRLNIETPVDEAVLGRVAKVIPEFLQAYEPEGLAARDFDGYGATKMTLEGFDVTGWQKLLTL